MSALGFKARAACSLVCFLTCEQPIPQIYLWCDTCWLYRGSQAFLNHVLRALTSPLHPWSALWMRTNGKIERRRLIPRRILDPFHLLQCNAMRLFFFCDVLFSTNYLRRVTLTFNTEQDYHNYLFFEVVCSSKSWAEITYQCDKYNKWLLEELGHKYD